MKTNVVTAQLGNLYGGDNSISTNSHSDTAKYQRIRILLLSIDHLLWYGHSLAISQILDGNKQLITHMYPHKSLLFSSSSGLDMNPSLYQSASLNFSHSDCKHDGTSSEHKA